MDHRHPVLFDKVAKASIRIIDTFKSQTLANTVNAYTKMDHHHPVLFDKVAKASIRIIDTFKSQTLANTVNAYAKMDHHHPVLFDKVAKASIPIIDTFDSQGLANVVSAFARALHGSQAGSALYNKVADTIKKNPAYLNNSTDVQLVAVAYAFFKANRDEERLLDMIGKEIKGRGGQVMLDAHQLGNLAGAFSCYATPISAKVLQLTFQKYLEQVSRSDERTLESTADIFGAIPSGQRLNVVPSDFLEEIAKLAIENARQARMEDDRDILLNVSRVDKLDQQLRQELYATYKPLVEKYRADISPNTRNLINQVYDGFDTLS
jgi:hypothetical protein